jgi:hypothetical protein
MSEMSMNRVIHAAVRRDLDRFVAALGTFPPGDIGRAKQLGTAWRNFEFELTYHHEGEHATAWPALEQVGVSRELLHEMDEEHAVMGQALVEAGEAMTALTRTAGLEESRAAAAAFTRLREVTVRHLDHEEAELEPVYLENHDAPAMKEMGKKFAKVSPARGGHFFAWLLDDASPDARAAIGDTVPAPVLAALTAVFGRRYRKQVASVWG